MKKMIFKMIIEEIYRILIGKYRGRRKCKYGNYSDSIVIWANADTGNMDGPSRLKRGTMLYIMEVKKLQLWSQRVLGSNSGSASYKICDLEQFPNSGSHFPHL